MGEIIVGVVDITGRAGTAREVGVRAATLDGGRCDAGGAVNAEDVAGVAHRADAVGAVVVAVRDGGVHGGAVGAADVVAGRAGDAVLVGVVGSALGDDLGGGHGNAAVGSAVKVVSAVASETSSGQPENCTVVASGDLNACGVREVIKVAYVANDAGVLRVALQASQTARLVGECDEEEAQGEGFKHQL